MTQLNDTKLEIALNNFRKKDNVSDQQPCHNGYFKSFLTNNSFRRANSDTSLLRYTSQTTNHAQNITTEQSLLLSRSPFRNKLLPLLRRAAQFDASRGSHIAKHLTTCLNDASTLLLLSIGQSSGLLQVLSSFDEQFVCITDIAEKAGLEYGERIVSEWVGGLISSGLVDCISDDQQVIQIRLSKAIRQVAYSQIIMAAKCLISASRVMINGKESESEIDYSTGSNNMMWLSTCSLIINKIEDRQWGVIVGDGGWWMAEEIIQSVSDCWIVVYDYAKTNNSDCNDVKSNIRRRYGEMIEKSIYDIGIIGATEEIENIGSRVCESIREGGMIVWIGLRDENEKRHGDYGIRIWANAIEVMNGFGSSKFNSNERLEKTPRKRFWKGSEISKVVQKYGLKRVRIEYDSKDVLYCAVVGYKVNME